MAFDPMIEDAPEPAPPPPDPMAAVNAQLADMRAQINQAYQANKGIAPQVQYVPYPAYQQEEDAALTEADILADLPGAIQREAERISGERERALREEIGGHLSRVYEKDFERDLQSLAANPHYKFVEEELKEHFKSNPADKFTPGRLQEKYNALVGAKISEIQTAERAAAESNEPATFRTVEHPIPVSSSSTPRIAKDEPALGEDEEAARNRWNRQMGLSMNKAEWVAWRDGELGPKDEEEGDGY